MGVNRSVVALDNNGEVVERISLQTSYSLSATNLRVYASS